MPPSDPRRLARRLLLALPLAACLGAVLVPAGAVEPVALDKAVGAGEAERIAAIEKVSPSVVAVCMHGGQAVGSGVVIDPEGYALTNFHVVQPTGPILQCGLPDGKLYDAVLVGLDKVGDIALVKLLPKKAGDKFPAVALGDSDAVRAGDWSLAMGNPFSLAMDFSPTVTCGLVSAVNRYQPPEGKGLLEYTDCIQIETSINPGNSGGPLFDMKGELIGINGRGSFEKRGRVNSGVGYAISINQIKNFLGHLRAGMDTDHATLGAEIRTTDEEGDLNRMSVGQVLDESDAFRRGLHDGDRLVSFAGRPLSSTNQFKNVLGIFPKDWRMPLVYRRNNEKREVLVRLMGNVATEKEDPTVKVDAPPGPDGKPPKVVVGPKPKVPADSPAAKLYKEKKGFANYHFNEAAQAELLAAFRKHGDFSKLQGDWAADGAFDLGDRRGDMTFEVIEPKGDESSATVKLGFNVEYALKPLGSEEAGKSLDPIGSGGLLMALYHYRRLLTLGPKGFERGFHHGGTEPCYPPATDGAEARSLAAGRIDADVLRTQHASVECKWFFSKKDRQLIGFEAAAAKNEDPCEVYLSDFRAVDGRMLPHRLDVRRGDKRYGTLTVKAYRLKAG